MHVPWGWIRQRPHFIAEGLSEHNNVFVVYENPFKTKNLVENETEINISKIPRLPVKRYSLLYFINVYLVSRYLEKKCKENEIDIIWITDVRLYRYIKNINIDSIKVVYDCMDETLEFSYISKSKRLKRIISGDEIDLVNMCDHVFCSSETLMNRVMERTYLNKEKISVIHNALEYKGDNHTSGAVNEDLEAIFKNVRGSRYSVVTYVGTISEWFDIECILQSLNNNKEIVYLLVGPSEIALPSHERLIATGPVEHRYVNYIFENSDILVMPFKQSALIESVDPVKLYEYISSAKPVVSLDYRESRRFSEYVHLYSSCNQYIKMINDIVAGKCVSRDYSAIEFVARNTWDNRVELIQKYINAL